MSLNSKTVIKTVKDEVFTEMTVEQWLAALTDAVSDTQLELNRIVIEMSNVKEALNRFTDSAVKVLEMRSAPLIAPPKSEPPRYISSSPPHEWRWMPTNKKLFPSSIAEEFAPLDTAPEHVKNAARDGATVDGFAYWISNNGRWIYRRRI